MLEHVPAKLNAFADKNMLQSIDLARFLSAQAVSSERKARYVPDQNLVPGYAQ
jgi:hypothetical protein